ncbi:MAG: hypothetical protein Q9182_003206 [Xanthomendoza sp. 2 TL-2023]
MTTLESDLRRMIGNAKSFNEKSSQVFSDAEKIRKAVSNFMVENNPAYRSRDYKPFPTPVPEDWQPPPLKEKKADEPEVEAKDEVDRSARGVSTRRASSAATGVSNPPKSATPAVDGTDGLGERFDGNTFQVAQEKIVAEMLNLKNDEGEIIVGPFITLPSRELRDYYRVIKRPVSLKSVQKAVQGVRGREKPTGVSSFKSWATFEEEASCIWKNAYHYNEDGSDISEAARSLEKYFYRRLEEAKKVVAEPPQPKVKLRMPAKSPEPPKITLKFGGPKASSAIGVSVDSEALKRQQDLVNAGMNGQAAISAGPKVQPGGSQDVPITNGVSAPPRTSPQRTSSNSNEKSVVNGVKTESTMGQSPALAAVQSGANRTGPLDPQALITNLSISTHAGLKIDKHFHLDVSPSPTTTQQSITITLPSSYYFLQLVPTISANVMHRPYRTFVTVNNNRIASTPQRPDESDAKKPLYECRVGLGMNRIDLEFVAGLPRGAPKVGTGPDLEIEKITVFAHLVKT